MSVPNPDIMPPPPPAPRAPSSPSQSRARNDGPSASTSTSNATRPNPKGDEFLNRIVAAQRRQARPPKSQNSSNAGGGEGRGGDNRQLGGTSSLPIIQDMRAGEGSPQRSRGGKDRIMGGDSEKDGNRDPDGGGKDHGRYRRKGDFDRNGPGPGGNKRGHSDVRSRGSGGSVAGLSGNRDLGRHHSQPVSHAGSGPRKAIYQDDEEDDDDDFNRDLARHNVMRTTARDDDEEEEGEVRGLYEPGRDHDRDRSRGNEGERHAGHGDDYQDRPKVYRDREREGDGRGKNRALKRQDTPTDLRDGGSAYSGPNASTARGPTKSRNDVWSRDLPHQTNSVSGNSDGPYQGAGPMRKLFNPNIHDPLKFQKTTPSVSTGSTTTGSGTHVSGSSRTWTTTRGAGRAGSSLATSITLASRERYGDMDKINDGMRELVPPSQASRDREREGEREGDMRRSVRVVTEEPEEEDDLVAADRERERRRRREGSERGSLGVASAGRKRDEERSRGSRGSRSSEGSESLKDRERGRGKNDTGAMTRLREAYKVIQANEQNLAELHRRMSADPAGGVRSLVQAGLLGHMAPVMGGAAQIFNPNIGRGAVGVFRQAEEDEDEYSRSTSISRKTPKDGADGIDAISSEKEEEGWVDLVGRHKRLADAHQDFLSISLDPQIPTSMHNLPVKYNIPTRLWQTGFHLLLERMRLTWIANAPTTSSMNSNPQHSRLPQRDTKLSARVLDHLTDFIYDAYSFYTNLLEEQALSNFKTAWLEALGDLARYRMAVAAHVAAAERLENAQAGKSQPPQNKKLGRIDEDDDAPFPSGASIGAEVAESWHVEERDTWRITARDWYVKGLTEKPGEGRLHHHLALLCRDVRGEENRALYHFTKSLTTSHPYTPSRESVLPLFDNAVQKRRSSPESSAAELFLLLHGMLFTKIQLDDFDSVFDRLMERLEEDIHAGTGNLEGKRPIPQIEWLVMAIVNIGAVMQYGADDGLIRKALAEEFAHRKVQKTAPSSAPQILLVHTSPDGDQKSADDGASSGGDAAVAGTKKLNINGNGIIDLENTPLTFRYACRLTFTMFEFCLKHPVRALGLTNVLNPHITAIGTFLATILRQPSALAVLERSIPWAALLEFCNNIPRKIELRSDVAPKLVNGLPLPEDWCIRGLEWVGRRVYERGFWKVKSSSTSSIHGNHKPNMGPAQPRPGSKIQNEMDVLLAEHDIVLERGEEAVVDEDEVEDVDSPVATTQRRWRRAAWVAGVLANHVPGFSFESPTTRNLVIPANGLLAEKLETWRLEKEREAESERARKRRDEELRGEWALDVEAVAPEGEESESDDETADPVLQELRARRRHLRSLLAAPQPKARVPRKQQTYGQKIAGRLGALPGYTVLVFDTNVLLSSLELFSKTAESGQWTVVVPLPVITELDGLSKQPPPLGPAAASAVAYLETHIRPLSKNLKVQTSKGNYLAHLVVRAEAMDFGSSKDSGVDMETAKAQTMDDFILRVATFQQTNFTDRSAILGFDSRTHPDHEEKKRTAAKVLFITFDRNLRLRARARGIDAADEKEMAHVLGT